MRFNLTDVLLTFLVLSVVYYAEWRYPSKELSQCVWPLGPDSNRIALIADPQIVDDHTYPGRNWLLSWFTRVVTDRYLARNFRLLHSNLKPNNIFFLGDLFDGGRDWDDKVWYAEFERWKQIFPKSNKTSHFMSLPGNHDVGSADDIIPKSYERFVKEFGEANQINTINGVSLVSLDTNSLLNKKSPSVNLPAVDFYEDLKKKRGSYGSMIIFSHIPLYRPDGAYCGLEREGVPFDWVQGDQFVTEVNPVLTDDILLNLRPVLVFSGDDHDACKYRHEWTSDDATDEYTVKSFSMASGISRPGFQLLALDSHGKIGTESCILGKPFYPIIFQGVALALLVVLTLLGNLWGSRKSGYKRVGDTEKGVKVNVVNRLPREVTRRLLIIGFSWLAGQFFINVWSYTSALTMPTVLETLASKFGTIPSIIMFSISTQMVFPHYENCELVNLRSA